jgi:hypothetical protein
MSTSPALALPPDLLPRRLPLVLVLLSSRLLLESAGRRSRWAVAAFSPSTTTILHVGIDPTCKQMW